MTTALKDWHDDQCSAYSEACECDLRFALIAERDAALSRLRLAITALEKLYEQGHDNGICAEALREIGDIPGEDK